jgi:type I restriction enzyme, S subunit
LTHLPQGWAIATLSQLVASGGIFSDGDWIESKDQDPDGTIRLLQLADIGDGVFFDKSNRFINEATFDRLRCTEVLPGDVLIARMPDPLGRACLAAPSKQKRITVVDVAIVRPGPDSVKPTWLMHVINAPKVREVIELESSGTTRRRIARGKLAVLSLPVPPLGEQQRIAEKVGSLRAKVRSCRERLDRVPQILKRFRESVLEAAVSGRLTEEWRLSRGIAGHQVHSFEEIDGDAFRGYEFPASWERTRLSEIADIAGGITKDSKRQELKGEELPYLRVANVQRGFLNLSEMKTIRVPQDRVESLLLHPGDMLFNEGGDIDKLGRGWIWEGQIDRCVFQNHVFRGRLRDTQFAPRFYSHYANSRGFDYFLARGKQTTNLASINKTVLSSLPVPVPTIEEQAEIVRRIDQLLGFADNLERRYQIVASDVAMLTPSVLAKAFRGELVPQDPNDEPAGEMLERISRERKEVEVAPKKKVAIRTGVAAIIQASDRVEAVGHAEKYTLTPILKKQGRLSPEALLQSSGLDIDEFYDQLKIEVAEGLLKEVRRGKDQIGRWIEAIK